MYEALQSARVEVGAPNKAVEKVVIAAREARSSVPRWLLERRRGKRVTMPQQPVP